MMLLKVLLLTGSMVIYTGLTAFAGPSLWLRLMEAAAKLYSSETYLNPVLLWLTPTASKSKGLNPFWTVIFCAESEGIINSQQIFTLPASFTGPTGGIQLRLRREVLMEWTAPLWSLTTLYGLMGLHLVNSSVQSF